MNPKFISGIGTLDVKLQHSLPSMVILNILTMYNAESLHEYLTLQDKFKKIEILGHSTFQIMWVWNNRIERIIAHSQFPEPSSFIINLYLEFSKTKAPSFYLKKAKPGQDTRDKLEEMASLWGWWNTDTFSIENSPSTERIHLLKWTATWASSSHITIFRFHKYLWLWGKESPTLFHLWMTRRLSSLIQTWPQRSKHSSSQGFIW